MEKSMEILLAKLNEKLDQQTVTITTLVTTKVMEALDEKLKILTEENTKLQTKVTVLEQKLSAVEKDKRKQNLVFFGLEERGKTEAELVDYLKEIIKATGTYLESHEISNIYRIGQRTNKNRPVVVSITSTWKKHIIMKKKANFPPGIYVKEDYPKEVIEKRRQLQTQLEEERKKGNFAYLKYDKLIVRKQNENTREKRKREDTSPQNSSTQKRVTVTTEENTSTQSSDKTTRGILKPNILNYVTRGRSHSFSELPKN